jgi:hypothetical protein
MMYSGRAKNQIAIGDDRRGAESVKGAVLRRRQARHRVTIVAPQVVGNRQFFAEPDDAIRLRYAKMMHSQHEWSPLRVSPHHSPTDQTATGLRGKHRTIAGVCPPHRWTLDLQLTMTPRESSAQN